MLVLKGIGPRGYPGMPELGNIRIPAKLLAQGVTDMVRISDGRMSGTAFGTVVLHVAPEAAVGGPLALVAPETGSNSMSSRARCHCWSPTKNLRRAGPSGSRPQTPARGYERLFVEHVTQADEGIDFDFLVGRTTGPASPRRSL